MYDSILFPTDGSETATAAFEYALDVAGTHDATLYVLNVADTSANGTAGMPDEAIDALEREGERIVDELAARAAARDVPVETDVLAGDPAETIVDHAAGIGVGLVVMPTHGRRGLERLLLGSVTERVVNTAPVPVLTVPPDAAATDALAYPSRTVLVPTDGSRGAERALGTGIEFATASDAALHLLHVVETASLGIDVRSVVAEGELEERADEILDAANDTAREAGLDEVSTAVSYGRPGREILSYVESEGVDVLVLGTRGTTDFGRYTLGGVSAKLLRASPVPVLMVRGTADSETTA